MSSTTHESGVDAAGCRYPTCATTRPRAAPSRRWPASHGRSLTFSDTDEPERALGAAVGWRLFSMLGIAPALGRDFTAADDRVGAADVVILSDELWRRRYNADPGIVGRPVTINARPYTVIGVLPPRVKFPFLQVAWVPLTPLVARSPRARRAPRGVRADRPGRTLAQARDELTAMAGRLARSTRRTTAGACASTR